LSDAVWSSTRIAVDYERGDGAVRRVLEPLGVVLKAGIWYVVARVDEQIRTYRVSRVVATEPTTERFERPDGFDLAAYWAESAAAFERDVPRVEVVIRVHPDGLDRLRAAVGGAVLRAAETLADHDPEGWTRLRIRLDYPDEAPGVLLGAGPLVDVVSPPEVRAEVAATARAVAARYIDG
jgi:predicted DNA-binding transcriptional regulator YafY